MGAGRTLFIWGPWLTYIWPMKRLSTSRLGTFCWALATAERRTFSMIWLAFFLFEKVRSVSASPTNRSRTRSAPSRAFWGNFRPYLPMACGTKLSWFISLAYLDSLGGLGGVALEGSRRRELPQLVPDHILGDEDGDELPPVVNGDGDADHLRDDGRAAGPSLDDLSLLDGAHAQDLLPEGGIDKRTFLERPAHGYLLLLRTMKACVRLFCLVLYPLVGIPSGPNGRRPPLDLTPPT